MKKHTPKIRLCSILLGLLCTVGLATACNDTPDEPDTTPETTAEVTAEVTEPTTEEDTEAETECHILFEDNFDGTALDPAKWNVGTPEDQPGGSNDVSLWDESMAVLDGQGHLLLKMEWDAEAKAARSGAVTTKGLFEAGYGYYEASIQFPLTYARSNFFSITAGDVEIDVMKSINGKDAVTYEHNLSGGSSDPVTVAALEKNLINIYDGRNHTFGVLRSAEGYTFYIDGKESEHIPADSFAPTAEDGFLSLFWEAPKSDGAGRNENKQSTPAEMVVDYVRVYSSLPETLGKPEASQAELVFTDDFDGEEIDFTKWSRCPEWTRNPTCYWSNDMTDVDGEGHLVVSMEWDAEQASLKSGGIWTASTFKFTYGYCEASIKFPKAYGTWGAFWMMCGDVWTESAVTGVEIDIVESINNETGAYNHALHSNYASLNSLGPVKLFQTDIYDGEYHTFGVLRAENGYFFYVDGKLSGLVPHYKYAPCAAEGYMELTCEAADWAGIGAEESIAQLPAKMLTDYVRVWDSMPDLAETAND